MGTSRTDTTDATACDSAAVGRSQHAAMETDEDISEADEGDNISHAATDAPSTCIGDEEGDIAAIQEPPPSAAMPLHRSRSISSRRNVNLSHSPLSLLALLLVASSSSFTSNKSFAVTAQEQQCSCSPLQYNFRLNLSATCPPLPPPFPPNDVFGAGVKDYTCTIGPESLPNAPQVTSEDTLVLDELDDVDDGDEDDEDDEEDGGNSLRGRRSLFSICHYFPDVSYCNSQGLQQQNSQGQQQQQGQSRPRPNKPANAGKAADYFPELDLINSTDILWDSTSAVFQAQSVTTSDIDTTPVSIYSIQFLEVDTSFNVINQDSSYVRDIDFMNGDEFTYASISATEPGVIPGGMNMVLRGVNAAGEPIRNVFTITYTNDCGIQTFEKGDEIGWVVFVSFTYLVQCHFNDLVYITITTSRFYKSPSNIPFFLSLPYSLQENFEPATKEMCDEGDHISTKPTPKTPSPPTRRPSPSKKPSGGGGWGSPSPDDDYFPGVFSKSAKSSKGSKSSKGGKSNKSGKSHNTSHSKEDGSWWNGYRPKAGKRSSDEGYGKRRSNEPIRDLHADDETAETVEKVDDRDDPRRGLQQGTVEAEDAREHLVHFLRR